MALAFGNTKGKAVSNKVATYEYKDGENIVRLIGGVLPRYIYWVKGTNGKDIPLECLAFNREAEKFDNSQVDHVTTYFPDKKCSWAYAVNCIDVKTGEVLALNLKKKLFEQILTAAESLGDPTDYVEGWDIVFKKAKTGPLPYNVEYTLLQLKLKKRALTEAEIEAAEAAKSIDEKFPRPTPEDVLKTIEKIKNGQEDDAPAGTDGEAIKELG